MAYPELLQVMILYYNDVPGIKLPFISDAYSTRYLVLLTRFHHVYVYTRAISEVSRLPS